MLEEAEGQVSPLGIGFLRHSQVSALSPLVQWSLNSSAVQQSCHSHSQLL